MTQGGAPQEFTYLENRDIYDAVVLRGMGSARRSLAIATAMRENLWLYPTVEIVHILGFVILVGAVVMFAGVGFALLVGSLSASGEDKKPVEPTPEQLRAAKDAFAKYGFFSGFNVRQTSDAIGGTQCWSRR